MRFFYHLNESKHGYNKVPIYRNYLSYVFLEISLNFNDNYNRENKAFNSLSATGDRGRQPPLLPPLLGAIRVDTIINNYEIIACLRLRNRMRYAWTSHSAIDINAHTHT